MARPKVEFALKPYPLQQEILDTLDGKILNHRGQPYRFCMPILGRQSGKSFLAKYTGLDRAINRGQYVKWVSPAISSARDHWEDILKLIDGLPVVRVSHTAKTVFFIGGGKLEIRSAIKPDNLRGPSVDCVIMDEAAFYENGAYVWYQVVLPMITATGGVVLFPTTPNGMNWVYDLFRLGQDPKSDYYKSWQAPSWVSPYQDRKLLETIKLTMPSKAYREEFGAEFLADGGGVFAGVLRAATEKPQQEPEALQELVAGIDIGFNNDSTTFTVIDKNTRKQVFGKRINNVGTLDTVRNILALLDHWNPAITYVERNGLGEHLLGLIKEVVAGKGEGDLHRFIQMNTSNDLEYPETDTGGSAVVGSRQYTIRGVYVDNLKKRNLVERVAADIEYGRLKILDPKQSDYGDTQIKEMSTYERKRTASMVHVTYGAADGAHDDTIAALYLAYMGVPRPPKFVLPNKNKGKKQERRRSPFRANGVRRTYAQRKRIHTTD